MNPETPKATRKFEQTFAPRDLNLSTLVGSPHHERYDSGNEFFEELHAKGLDAQAVCVLPGEEQVLFVELDLTDAGSTEEIVTILEDWDCYERYIGYGTGIANVGFSEVGDVISNINRYSMGDHAKLYLPFTVAYDY